LHTLPAMITPVPDPISGNADKAASNDSPLFCSDPQGNAAQIDRICASDLMNAGSPAAAPNSGYRAPLPSLAVTVRDSQLGQVRAELSRHGEHPGVSVGMAERCDGLACWQLLLTVSVRC